MKKIFSTLVLAMMALVVFAANKNLENDITMVSYEQSSIDIRGTLALKNNTKEEVRNVTFIITYLDMDGNEMDYQEFQEDMTIAPGMTKKIDIPAYEYHRFYHYYKTEDDNSDHPAFKIKFQLKDYNTEGVAEDSFLGSDVGRCDMSYVAILFIVGVLVFIGIAIGMYVLVAVMAQKRHRNVVLWILLSILVSPLIIAIILLAIGNSEKDDFRNLE
jgi:hypothetical protein